MKNEILNKFNIIVLKNGVIVEGFVSKINDKYLTLTESDNSKVIVKVDEIAMIRIPVYSENNFKQEANQPSLREQIIGIRSQRTPKEPNTQLEFPEYSIPHREEEYSMALPKLPTGGPKFERNT